MSSRRANYRWMGDLLELLFERHDIDTARGLLRDEAARAPALAEFTDVLSQAGMSAGMLRTREGEQLALAVLALRVKFPIEEARRKVALNIAMREGRV